MDVNTLNKVRNFVEGYFQKKNLTCLSYHNIEHTKAVVENTQLIGMASELDNDQLQIAIIAAWCHDLGYGTGDLAHETESARLAILLLCDLQFSSDQINAVVGCINATKIPQKPHSKIEKVLCDADLAHLGSSKYFEISERLRVENEFTRAKEISRFDWLSESRAFFEQHQYFTKFGKNILEPIKQKNYKSILIKLNEHAIAR